MNDLKWLVYLRQAVLVQLSSDLGMSDRVIFSGFVPTEDLVLHYRLVDGLRKISCCVFNLNE
ncbi:hypothetical protein H6F32_09945 [Anabaena sp. FACHB-1237]|uniref:hypothetical protein n=1 Tax=Anabaena sp. FACHB-1237 TaxID=2692769 RepID=UPI0016808B76|nr:hypothetical protein [Anabaena sp. FACHB-1237]MBD2137902.1 hypothetical protein [Anabaena sp. FACHB-1237]